VPASASARFNAASIARVAPMFVTADDPGARTSERSLVQAAHIVPDVEPEGIAAVVNGLALCAIHHLAFDRNVLGIDPDGVVHIARRVLDETDGPMLRTGLQGFHARGSPSRGGRRTGRTRGGSSCASSASNAPRLDGPARGCGGCGVARRVPAHASVRGRGDLATGERVSRLHT
jgi:hypothetical protein